MRGGWSLSLASHCPLSTIHYSLPTVHYSFPNAQRPFCTNCTLTNSSLQQKNREILAASGRETAAQLVFRLRRNATFAGFILHDATCRAKYRPGLDNNLHPACPDGAGRAKTWNCLAPSCSPQASETLSAEKSVKPVLYPPIPRLTHWPSATPVPPVVMALRPS